MSTPSKASGAEKPDRQRQGEDGEDLMTLLDKNQRSDLTLLVANVTESMRKTLLDNFNATSGLDTMLLREGMTEDEKLMNADPSRVDVGQYDRERKLKEEYEKDLASLKMKNLKKNALKAYDDWREQVMLRVGKAVNSPDIAKRQLEKEATAKRALPRAPDTSGSIGEVPDRNPNLKFKDLFPPVKTSLTKLPMNHRTFILHSILLLLLSLEHYNANSRILMLNLTSSLKMPLKTFEQDEYTTAKGLLEAAKEMTADEETKKKAEENKESRKWKVGLASVAGAAIIGVTGGLAAPLVAAGVGSVMGGIGLGATAAAGYLGSVAGSTVLVGGLFGAYGGRMTGKMMDAYAREVEDFEFLPVHSNKKTSEDQKQGAKQASEHDHKLRVTVCISGWLTEKEEVVKPWRVLGIGAEVFGLKYELEALLNLGNAMNGMVQSAAWGYAQKEIIQRTIFAELAAALWPIGLLKVARVIDNPFSVAKGRADKTGEILADALVNRAQGERPVTLIGYSLGARVIYTCLMHLAKRKAFGLVENAILMGSPTPSDTSDWRVLRTAVSGRLVNVFSQNDYVLGFMYRTSSVQYGVAGLQKVDGLPSVENVDVSEDVDGHLRYRFLIGSILKKIGFEDINMAAVEEEQLALQKMIEEEKKQSLQAQRRRLLRRESAGGKEDEAEEAEHEASELEKKVQEQTQKSMMTRAIEYFYTPGVPSTQDGQKAVANIQKSVPNLSQTKQSAAKTAKDATAATSTYSDYIKSRLPSLPQMTRSGSGTQQIPRSQAPTGHNAQPSKQATGKTQSYTSRAAGYLPNMPNMSNMPNMPSLPTIPGRSQSKKSSQPVEAAKKTADAGQAGLTTTAGVVTATVKPTVVNAANIKDNPAVKSAQSTAKNMPIIHQNTDRADSKESSAPKAVSDNVSNTLSNVTSKASPSAKDTNIKSPTPQQSYTSKAASYLPNMPSMPTFGSEAPKKQPPKLEKRNSGMKSPPPPLQKTNSGLEKVKSPPPKLGPRTPSGRSGIKSPPPLPPSGKLERLPSGVKNAVPNLPTLPS